VHLIVLFYSLPCSELVSSLDEKSFPLRAEVEGYNNRRLNALVCGTQFYQAMDSRGYNAKGEPIDKEMAQRLLDRLVAPREISLKVMRDVVLSHPSFQANRIRCR
jgi:hypothetical protein